MPDYEINELINRFWDNYKKYRKIYFYNGENDLVRTLLTYGPGVLLVVLFIALANLLNISYLTYIPSSVGLYLIFLFVESSSAKRISKQEDKAFRDATNAATSQYSKDKNALIWLNKLLAIETRSYHPHLINWHKMMCAQALAECNFYSDAAALLYSVELVDDPEGFRKERVKIEEKLQLLVFKSIEIYVEKYQQKLPTNIQKNLYELIEEDEHDTVIEEFCLALAENNIVISTADYFGIMDIVQYFAADECLYENLRYAS